MTTDGSDDGNALFVLPRGEDRYYVYAPLRRALAVVNGASVNAITRFLQHGEDSLSPAEQACIAALRQDQLLGNPAPRPPVMPDGYSFCPHEVTLFLTSRCNLRCVYCYADAARKTVDMPWDVARAAIDVVVENAGLLGSRKCAVGFHGGGEPAMAWDMLVRCVEYAAAAAANAGLDVEHFAAMNGVLTPPQRDFIAAHFAGVTISLDGPRDIQDGNRPLASGDGSYDRVRETIADFDNRHFPYGIRATITDVTVHRMVEIVEHVHATCSTGHLHVEPVWECGRCARSGTKPPADEDFTRHFLAAAARGKELGIAVTYSGARLDTLTSKFCAAAGDGFAVLPEGIATSCFEVTEADDARASIFHYGRFDETSGRFTFDRDRLAALQTLSVEHITHCRDCFCKWHCAGDCLARVFEKHGASVHDGSIRCDLNRSLTLAALDALVSAESVHQDDIPPSVR